MDEEEEQFFDVEDYEREAKKILPPEFMMYYNYARERGWCYKDSIKAFSRYRIRGRNLQDVSKRTLSTTILGEPVEYPIGVAPSAWHAAAHPQAEAETAKAESAREAADAGVDGILVSAHGGRQMDGSPAPIDALAEVVEAVRGRGIEVYMDGGVRTGTDVFKALGRGARAVFVGRPILWGLACQGGKGVSHVLEILRSELESVFDNTGCTSPDSIPPDMVVHESYYHRPLQSKM